MENIWSPGVDSILLVGRSLEDMGIRNWALDREVALVALNKLAAAKVAILGGDVYLEKGSKIEPSYDNWYCRRVEWESSDEYIARSIAESVAYIERYKGDGGTPLFSLVPDVR